MFRDVKYTTIELYIHIFENFRLQNGPEFQRYIIAFWPFFIFLRYTFRVSPRMKWWKHQTVNLGLDLHQLRLAAVA